MATYEVVVIAREQQVWTVEADSAEEAADLYYEGDMMSTETVDSEIEDVALVYDDDDYDYDPYEDDEYEIDPLHVVEYD